MECPYCRQPAKLVTGAAMYPHRPDLIHKWFYRCFPCDAHVGCHPGTRNPLGRLANFELRTAKIAAHAAFDPIWRNGAGRPTPGSPGSLEYASRSATSACSTWPPATVSSRSAKVAADSSSTPTPFTH